MGLEELLNPFESATIPLDDWVAAALAWIVENYRPFFQSIKWPIDQVLKSFDWALNSVPPSFMILIFGFIAWQVAGVRLALAIVGSLVFLGFIGVWSATMTTLSIVFTSLALCILIGVPTGVVASRSNHFEAFLRPVLDAMQTIPAFVYLVPVVMLFGIGNVPGVIVTIIFALPPVIRLTNLGIRQVRSDVIEATLAFGATKRQVLFKVQFPLALPTIMAGVNQTLMMSLSMVVIASMIAVGGLGQMVLRGIGRLDMGIATVGGLGIVILAIVLDRLTQSVDSARGGQHTRWFERGPTGMVRRMALAVSSSRQGNDGGGPTSERSEADLGSVQPSKTS